MSHCDARKYIDQLIASNFLPISLLPTRITEKTSTIVDHIYYYEGKNSKSSLTLSTGNLLCDISDHLANFIIIHSHHSKQTIDERPYIRLISPKNKENFINELDKINWSDYIYGVIDPNTAYENFYDLILTAYTKSFSLIKLSRRGAKDKKWLTQGIKISSSHKNKLYRNWLASRKKADEIKYKEYKKVFARITKTAESDYYRNIFNLKSNSVKNIWDQINKLCSFKKNKLNINIKKLSINNNDIVLPNQIAQELNNYFVNVGSTLVSKLPKSNCIYTDFLNVPIQNSFYCDSISISEILSEINHLKKKKSTGPDVFNFTIVSDIAQQIVLPLQFIYNLSLETGIFPDKLKVAKIIPIYKKDDPNKPSNYRPISLLSIFSKLFEKILCRRLMQFWNRNNVLYDYQFGFREHHSTSLALIEVTDKIYKELDDGNFAAGIYIDLQKAFDTVDHNILLDKLYNCGIRGTPHKLLKDYLSNRLQYTVNGVSKSSMQLINCGVPQGSVLGPILFLIYVNDISNATDLTVPRLFADDTNLFLFDKCICNLEKSVTW